MLHIILVVGLKPFVGRADCMSCIRISCIFTHPDYLQELLLQ